VLVVEDDRTARRAIASILRLQGYAVSEAATLAEARRQSQPPHAHEWILLDLMLPDGNGIDLLRDIRLGVAPASRVCVITGCGSGMLRDVESFGPEHIFPKPLNVERLLDALNAPAAADDDPRAIAAG
jgi:two-component system OmpR family response regulator